MYFIVQSVQSTERSAWRSPSLFETPGMPSHEQTCCGPPDPQHSSSEPFLLSTLIISPQKSPKFLSWHNFFPFLAPCRAGSGYSLSLSKGKLRTMSWPTDSPAWPGSFSWPRRERDPHLPPRRRRGHGPQSLWSSLSTLTTKTCEFQEPVFTTSCLTRSGKRQVHISVRRKLFRFYIQITENTLDLIDFEPDIFLSNQKIKDDISNP